MRTIGTPIIWGGDDPFTHLLVIGPTRCGKTATILKPMIEQILVANKQGTPVGLSVVEPKGDLAFMVREMSEAMGLPYVHIDPAKNREYAINSDLGAGYQTNTFNPMQGDIDMIVEATVVVLKSMFGKQDPFFATVQELSTRYVTRLLKELHGDNINLMDVVRTLRDEKLLETKVKQLEARDGTTDLVQFFNSELLGSMKDKYRQFVIGLRAQLENITSNTQLKTIMTGESDINIDKHFQEGGILAVNTSLGELGSSGDAFGQFVIMHLQSGTFRRPGTERTRVPHFLIVDEYSRYINPDVERFLNIAAEYRVAGIFATQSLGQLEVESGKLSAKAVKRAIMGGCRNKIVFGGITYEDAKELAEEFGKRQIIERQSTFDNRVLIPNVFPTNYRDTEREEYRYTPTQLMDGLPRFHFIYKFLENGTPQPPAIGKGKFISRNWKELRRWEKGLKNTEKEESESKRVPFSWRPKRSLPKWTAKFRERLQENQNEESDKNDELDQEDRIETHTIRFISKKAETTKTIERGDSQATNELLEESPTDNRQAKTDSIVPNRQSESPEVIKNRNESESKKVTVSENKSSDTSENAFKNTTKNASISAIENKNVFNRNNFDACKKDSKKEKQVTPVQPVKKVANSTVGLFSGEETEEDDFF